MSFGQKNNRQLMKVNETIQYLLYTNVGKIKDDLKKPLIFTTFVQTDEGLSSGGGRYIITVPTFLAQEFAIFLSGALSTSQSVIIGGR